MKKSLPKDFPCRLYIVPGWAKPFKVPRYISRCDIDKHGFAGTHGWQVRYHRGNKFFGDATGRKRRSPQKSLAEAIQYLAEIYSGPRVLIRKAATKRRQESEILDPGIRIAKKIRQSGLEEIYIEAMSPKHGMSSKRVYVGTQNTATPERLEAARQKATSLRRQMEASHLASQQERRRKGDI